MAPNFLVLPSLALRYGRFAAAAPDEMGDEAQTA